MKFELCTVGRFYDWDDPKVSKLKALGFKFEKDTEVYHGKEWNSWYKLDGTVEIEINSLDELMAFVLNWGEIIIDKDSITIYDDYLG